MSLPAILAQLDSGAHLAPADAESLADAIIARNLSDDLTAQALLALRKRGETLPEITAFAQALLRQVHPPSSLPTQLPTLDLVGTGGDASSSLNISTAAALVAAAAGRHRLLLIKHGSRAASSRCGSADVLAALGLPIPIPDHRLAPCLDAANFVFLFAPRHHPALAPLAPLRRALGVRTIFNLLGPLVNPARPSHALIGTCSLTDAAHLGSAVTTLHAQRCLTVTSTNGWDEATPICPFHILDHRAAASSPPQPRLLSAADFGLPPCDPSALRGADAPFNAAAIRRLLAGEISPFRHAVILNAALALILADIETDHRAAAARAAEAIDSRAAENALAALIAAAGDAP